MIAYMYNSWRITYDPARPPMRAWHATQRGQTLAHNSEAAVRRMVDKRVREGVR